MILGMHGLTKISLNIVKAILVLLAPFRFVVVQSSLTRLLITHAATRSDCGNSGIMSAYDA